jgi:hypothetical protein
VQCTWRSCFIADVIFSKYSDDVHSKYIFYIDYTDPAALNERLQGCFRYMNRMDVNNVFTYSDRFVNWVTQILNPQ